MAVAQFLIRYVLPAVLLGVLSHAAWAQPLVRADPEIKPRTRALTVGGHLHTFGAGVDVQYTQRLPEFRKRYELLVHVGLSSFKDRDEGRVTSAWVNFGGRDYIFEKQNYAYFLAPTVGLQYILIERSEFNRVQVKAGLSAGPSIALLKPYYVDIVRVIPGTNTAELVPAVYDPISPTTMNRPHVPADVFGQSDFFQGFDRISARFGGRMRAVFTVDLSGSSYFVRAVNVGAQVDLYPRKLPIMLSGNEQVFVGFFAGVVLGSAW